MKGQWLGKYSVTNENGEMLNDNGSLRLDIDEVDDHFEAVAYIHPSDTNLLRRVVFFKTDSVLPEQHVSAIIAPIHPNTGLMCTWDEIKKIYSDISYSSSVNLNIKKTGNSLAISGVTDIELSVSSELNNSPSNTYSSISGEKMSWLDFKNHISSISKSKKQYLFRGQQQPWALRTSFHRLGRYRLNEFIEKDVKKLHQRLSAITSHYFDLNKPEQNGAFFNLLQHHGYPTPLLDWSYSPYVAAFFAFRDWPKMPIENKAVRIYYFDYPSWQKHFPQFTVLESPFLHLSVMEFIAIGNPRIVPQQSVTTTTNVDNIERYLLKQEEETGNKFIHAIDIPYTERNEVMAELRYMGITAATMFPGIDGVCEELMEVNFGHLIPPLTT